MDIKLKKQDLESKFADLKKKEEQAVIYLQWIKEELLRLQGEWRLLEEFGKEEKPADKPVEIVKEEPKKK